MKKTEEKPSRTMHFNPVNQCSPVQKDYIRVSKTDGLTEAISYEEVDYQKLQRSLGTVQDWNLDKLLKAGISPDMPIHTGNPTRLEGLSALGQFEAIADKLLGDKPEDVPFDTEKN